MKTISVAAAVMVRKGLIFATARGYGAQKGKWEFPGGKLESGESAEAAIRREILEELDVSITDLFRIGTVEYDYPEFHLSMACFFCRIESGEPVLKEALDARWLPLSALDEVDWLPADRVILPLIQEKLPVYESKSLEVDIS